MSSIVSYDITRIHINIDPNIWLDAIGLGLCIWLALYVMLRSKTTFLTFLISVGLLSQAFYFFSDSLIDGSPDNLLSLNLTRFSWWSALMPLASWFQVSWIIRKQTELSLIEGNLSWHRLFPYKVLGAYVLGGFLVIFGSFSNTIFDYNTITITDGNGQFFTRNGPLFPSVLVFVIVVGIGSFYNFSLALSAERKNPRQKVIQSASFFQNLVTFQNQLRILQYGSFFFGLAACYITFNQMQEGNLPSEIGYFFFFLGLILYGYALAIYNTLITRKENVTQNLLYSFIETIMVSVIFGGSFLLIVGLEDLRTLLEWNILLILAGSSIYVDNFRLLLGKLTDQITVRDKMNRGIAQQERKEAVEQIANIGTVSIDINSNRSEPLPLLKNGAEVFKKQVLEAFKNYTDTGKLSTNPLLHYDFVESRLEQMRDLSHPDDRKRIAVVRDILEEKVKTLAPDRKNCPNVTDRLWHEYNILYYRYIKGLNKRGRDSRLKKLNETKVMTEDIFNEINVLEWLFGVDNPNATFYDKFKKGSNAVASLLLEEFGH